jgi:hypothetical protein
VGSSVLSALSGIVSPALQFGAAVCRTGGSVGVPSSCSSLNVNAIPFSFRNRSGPNGLVSVLEETVGRGQPWRMRLGVSPL